MWSSKKDLDIDLPDFNDDDLNDPSLLAELEQLTLGEVKPVKMIKPEPQVVQVDEIISSLPLEDEPIDDQITEQDMNDPKLLVSLYLLRLNFY